MKNFVVFINLKFGNEMFEDKHISCSQKYRQQRKASNTKSKALALLYPSSVRRKFVCNLLNVRKALWPKLLNQSNYIQFYSTSSKEICIFVSNDCHTRNLAAMTVFRGKPMKFGMSYLLWGPYQLRMSHSKFKQDDVIGCGRL